MTNQEAIKEIELWLGKCPFDKTREAFNLAIKVLEERPQGEWLKSDVPESLLAKCSICGFDCGAYTHNFCPNCGTKMRKGNPDCMDEDAKEASIPYTYNAPQHDWKCGYPDIIRGKRYYKR